MNKPTLDDLTTAFVRGQQIKSGHDNIVSNGTYVAWFNSILRTVGYNFKAYVRQGNRWWVTSEHGQFRCWAPILNADDKLIGRLMIEEMTG